MKVLFDHQIFHYQYGGASKYFAMLLKHLPAGTWETTARLSANEYARAQHLFPTCRRHFRGQTVLTELLNRPYTLCTLRRGRYDVFHQTNFGTYCLRSLGSRPMVTTFHDTNLSTFDPHPDVVERQRISLQRADAVICVSHHTAQDMLRFFPIDERKVHVIHHGIDLPDLSLLPAARLLAPPYLLFVGRRSPYKNFDLLLQAFAELHAHRAELHLACTGAPFTSAERQRFCDLGLADSIHHFAASEADMQRLYRDAAAFVFPSRYEGFGMPILEAWSCRCPVVLARASCFPEIAADAGCYFDPDDAAELVAAVSRVLDDSAFRRELIARGEARLPLFSWQRCAEAHLSVYRSLL